MPSLGSGRNWVSAGMLADLTVWVRMGYSRTEDIVFLLRRNRNNVAVYKTVYKVARDLPDTAEAVVAKLRLNEPIEVRRDYFHICSDSNAATLFAVAAYLGANHGYALPFAVAENPLPDSRTGSLWLDDEGNRFIFIRTAPGLLRGSSRCLGMYFIGATEIRRLIAGCCLRDALTGQKLHLSETGYSQLCPFVGRPCNQFLMDGERALEPGGFLTGQFLELGVDYDIPDPFEAFRGHYAAVAQDFAAPEKFQRYLDALPPVSRHNIRYLFHPHGQVEVCYKFTAMAATQGVAQVMFDVIGYVLSKACAHERLFAYYPQITREYDVNGTKYAFRAIAPFDELAQTLYVRREDMSDPPNRSIVFLTSGSRPEDGFDDAFAFGYDMTFGAGTPAARLAANAGGQGSFADFPDSFWNIIRSRKTHAPIVCRALKPGEVFQVRSYLKYFDGSVKPGRLTDIYAVRSGDYYLLFLDGHQEVERELVSVPPELLGKKITAIVEKTPSLEFDLPHPPLLTDKGLTVSIRKMSGEQTPHGYLTLKVE